MIEPVLQPPPGSAEASSLFHPSGRLFRYTILILAGLLTYGSYFAYDSTGALSNTLKTAWNTTEDRLGALYTIYSVAAIFSVFLGGVLTDRLGVGRASLIFSGLIVVGAVIVAGAKSIPVALVGRFVFGAGSESLVVAQNAILTKWFRGKELALSFGITLTIARLGTLFSFNVMELLSKRFGWQLALAAAAGLCILCLVANLVYTALDRYGTRVLGLEESEAGDKIVLSDIFRFSRSYWYVVILCVGFYSAIFPFTALSTSFFHEKWGLPTTDYPEGASLVTAALWNFLHMTSTAGGTTSIIIFASMLCAPVAGWLVDRLGHRASLMVVGSILMVPAHLALGVTAYPPYYAMVVLGVAFVLVPAAMWPAVPLIVEKNRVGTAFGLMAMVQNIGLALFPWLNGMLRVQTGAYVASQWMFASLGLAGLVFAVLLLAEDRRRGGVLESPSQHES